MKKSSKIWKILIYSLIGLLLIAVIVYFVIVLSKANALVSPTRIGVYSSPDEIGYGDFTNLEIENEKGEKLKGWYIPSSKDAEVLSDKIIIVSHDYKSSRDLNEIGGIYLFKYFLDSGIDVVSFDYSGSGESGGKYYSFGVDESKELISIIEYVHQYNENAKIALYGIGFGGDAAVCSGSLSSYVSYIIADSAVSDVGSFMSKNMNVFMDTYIPFMNANILNTARSISGSDFVIFQPFKYIEVADGKNYFFIHGEKDSIIENSNSLALAQAVDTEKSKYDIWIIQDSDHLEGFTDLGETYANRILNFLDKFGF